MNKFSALLVTFSLTASSSTFAGTYYDDWDVERVPDQIKNTTLYYGQSTCQASIKLFPSFVAAPEIYDYYVNRTYAEATSEARPVFIVYAPYTYDDGPTDLNHSYYCTLSSDLPNTYVKSEVLSYKNKYTPRQPFATYAMYEYGICRYGVRRGIIDITEPVSGANNMKVFASTGSSDYPDNKIYDGVPLGLVGYNIAVSENTSRRFRVKFDEGSSFYLNSGTIPKCTGSRDDAIPK